MTDNSHIDALASRMALYVVSDEQAQNPQSGQDIASLEWLKQQRRLRNTGFEKREIEALMNFRLTSEWLSKKNMIVDLFVDGNGIAFLIGKCGTGKTATACYIAKELMTEYGKSVLYVKAIRFFMGLKQCWRRDAVKSESEYLAAFEKPDILIIDEMQDRSAGDWENSILADLIDQRYRTCKSTLILSHLEYNQVKQTTPESIWSRAEQTGTFVGLNNESYRKQSTNN